MIEVSVADATPNSTSTSSSPAPLNSQAAATTEVDENVIVLDGRKVRFQGHVYHMNKDCGTSKYYVCDAMRYNGCSGRLVLRNGVAIVTRPHSDACKAGEKHGAHKRLTLMHKGHKFVWTSDAESTRNFVCVRGDCPGRVVQSFIGGDISGKAEITLIHEHNHCLPNWLSKSSLPIKTAQPMLQFALPFKQPTSPVAVDANSNVLFPSSSLSSTTPSFLASIGINRARVCLDQESRAFLLADDGLEDRILIFGTGHNVKLLSESSRWIVDGGFDNPPELFPELVILSTLSETSRSMLYCLLPDRSERTFLRMFSLINKTVQERFNLAFQPSKIQTYFDDGLLSALRQTFPGAVLKGLHFHFVRSLSQSVQQLGLLELLISNMSVRQWFRRILSLPFLPSSNRAVNAWCGVLLPQLAVIVSELTSGGGSTPNLQALLSLAGEISSMWIQGMFPPSLWIQEQDDFMATLVSQEQHTSLDNRLESCKTTIVECFALLRDEERRISKGLTVSGKSRTSFSKGDTAATVSLIRGAMQHVSEVQLAFASGAKTETQFLDSVIEFIEPDSSKHSPGVQPSSNAVAVRTVSD